MEKVDLPKGLIRFASEDEIEKKEKFKVTPRMKGYAAVLFILVGLLIGMLFLRNDVQANILRLPGQLYERVDNNFISNVFTFKILNKTNKDIENVELKLLSHEGKIKLVGHENLFIPAQGMAKGTLFLQIKASALNGDKNKVKIGVYRNNKLIETATTNFLGPRSY
jgi:preprotein translocase subunit Sec61beta